MNATGKFPWKTTILAVMVILLALIGAVVFLESHEGHPRFGE